MIQRSLFGKMQDGREVFNYTFIDNRGQSVTISEYACAILSTNILAQNGKIYDVTLGYDTLSEYLSDTRNFGAIVGRYANRIANGRFILNGVTYHLPQNNGINTLHGGFQGFGKKLFSGEIKGDCVEFRLESPDLDCGFPGNFVLVERASFIDGALKMEYEYICDKDTPASITNHNYFNLNGHGHGSILNHELVINSEKYCKAKSDLIALAPSVDVAGTAFDFRQPRKIIDGIFTYSPELIYAKGGYDHCFDVRDHDVSKPVAIITGDISKIKLEVYSDMPALQFYSGNSIGHTFGKNGAYYNDHEGFALECQQFPNAVNEPYFPDAIIKAGQLTKKFITYKFA